MLNQTNIGNNNNKFYVIQIIKDQNTFYSWNRWGRVVSGSGGRRSGRSSSKLKPDVVQVRVRVQVPVMSFPLT